MYSMNDTYGTTDKILLVETGGKYIFDCIPVTILHSVVQWNLSVTTTSLIKFITCDLFSNVF